MCVWEVGGCWGWEREREGTTLMRNREAWLFPLHDSFNGVTARIFETFAKWPVGSTSLAFASAWRYFGKRDEGLPVIPTKAFVVAENGLFKKCRVQGWEGMVAHAGVQARCVVWAARLCLRSPPTDRVGRIWMEGPDVLPVAGAELRACWPSEIFW